MSTTWWAASLKPTDNRDVFDEAVDDIRWVIEQILEPLEKPAPVTTEAAKDPSPPQGVQKSIPTATWQARGDGKCQSKPSLRLRESLD